MSQGLRTRLALSPVKVTAEQRLCRMRMRANGQLLTQGKLYTPAAHTDIRRTFRLYDFVPPSERHD